MPKSVNKGPAGHPPANALDNLPTEQLSYDRAAGLQIFDGLKLAILRMDIAPGTLISEAEVALHFGASRTPVREAFMQLRAANLIVTRPSRGNYVTMLSEGRIKESQFIRQAIELANIRQLCNNGISQTYREALENILERQSRCLTSDQRFEFQALDDQFHLTLAKATGYARVAELLEREKMNLDRLRIFSLKDQTHRQELYREHRKIFDVVSGGDWATAEKLMQHHLHSILGTLSRFSEIHSDYFE